MSRAILNSCQYQNHRRIDLIVVHCSATRCTSHTPLDVIIAWHQARGFSTIGYHYYITRDGDVHQGRPLHQVGAMHKGTTSTPSVCAMRADWMRRVHRPIPVPPNRKKVCNGY